MRDQTMKIPQAEENIRDQQCPESLGTTRNLWSGHWPANLSVQLRPPTPLHSLHFGGLDCTVRHHHVKSMAIERDILRLTLTNFISEHFNDEFE